MRVRTLRQRMQLVLAERSRIARELHDTLLQGFAGVTMEMQALSVRLPGSEERRSLEEIIRDAAACLKEARRSVAGLRDRPGGGGGFAGLLAAAAREMTRDSGVELRVKVPADGNAADGAAGLSANVEYHLMRIAREAMGNAVKHARATVIEVELAIEGDQLRLVVRDDGAGFATGKAAAAGHFGVIGMRERAREIGATIEVISAPGAGTRIVVRRAVDGEARQAAMVGEAGAAGVPAAGTGGSA
jgi:signal transduction histidine kinase